MAATGSFPWREPARPGRRVFEWGLLASVILALVLLLLRQGQQVQGQAELAAIKMTLGALRTAAIMDHLQAKARGKPAATPDNPFDLLQARPAHYLGVLGPGQASAAHPGSWWLDPECRCVVYAPLEPRWLAANSGGQMLRFRVTTSGGPLQLVALEAYLWQGQRVE